MFENILICFFLLALGLWIIGKAVQFEQEQERPHIDKIVTALRSHKEIRQNLSDPVLAPLYAKKVRDECDRKYGPNSMSYRAFLELKAVIEEDIRKEGNK